jgi:hypothetical protein
MAAAANSAMTTMSPIVVPHRFICGATGWPGGGD